jgi:cbb3-type cytochrome oxidase maturation protein
MSVIYIVLPMALLFAGVAVWGFVWAVRQGQLDDLETPAARILLDDEGGPPREVGFGDETVSQERRAGGSGGSAAAERR